MKFDVYQQVEEVALTLHISCTIAKIARVFPVLWQ